MDDEVGTREAAERLGVTRMAILQRLAAGQLQGRRTTTGRWRIPRAEVDRLAHPEPPLEGNLTVREAAAALDMTVSAVQARLRRGQLKGHRIAGRSGLVWQIPRAAVLALVQVRAMKRVEAVPPANSLTVAEAAAALGVTPHRVRRWIGQGLLTDAQPHERKVRIPQGEIERWQAQGPPAGRSEPR